VGHALALCWAGEAWGAAAEAAQPAATRLLASAPSRSAAAERAAEQSRYAQLAEVKARQTAANVRAAESRRMMRGDWKARVPGCVELGLGWL